MRTRNCMVAAGLLVLLAGASWGAGFSPSTTGTAGAVGRGGEGSTCGATLLTQSTSQTILTGNSVSCNLAGIHADNSYFRAYDMTGFPDGFDVCEVEVGIEQALGGAGSQPITVNVYANSGAAFPPGTLTLVGTAAVNVTDQSLSVLTVPLAASIPAGTAEMILEVFTPDGAPAGNSFFIGSNNLGQSGPSYIQAADCGVTVPTPTAAIGFPDTHIVLNAGGDAAGGEPTPSIVEVPTLGGWGLALLVVVLAGAAFVALRKRAVA